MFSPITSPGPPPDLQQGRLKQWLQDTFKSQTGVLRSLALASTIAKPTYGPTVQPDLSQGSIQQVVATDANPFTINAPTNIGPLAIWQLVIQNNSGGALGAVTFASGINQFGFADPGAGNLAIATFQVNGTTSYQVGPWQGSPISVNTLTYSSSITPDLSKGTIQEVVVTDGNPFTINAPKNALQAGYWELVIENHSGGPLGTVTLDPNLHVRGFADPGNGFRTSVILHQEAGVTHQDAPWVGTSLGVATAVVTAAQIVAGTPVQIIAPPGAGHFLVPVGGALSTSAGGFTSVGGNIKVGYGSGLASPFLSGGSTVLTQPGPAVFTFYPPGSLLANVVNQGIFFQATGFTGGSGTLEVSLAYYATTA